MLKIRRPLGRLIFNMGITIPGKTVFLIETAPSFFIMDQYNIISHSVWLASSGYTHRSDYSVSPIYRGHVYRCISYINSQKTLHSSPSWASHGVSFMSVLKIKHCVIKGAPTCLYWWSSTGGDAVVSSSRSVTTSSVCDSSGSLELWLHICWAPHKKVQPVTIKSLI